MTIMQAALYDRICMALTDYETGNASADDSLKDFYGLLCEVQKRIGEGWFCNE